MVAGDETGQHCESLLPQEFYRYGYVETLFGLELINYLGKKQMLSPQLISILNQALLTEETESDGTTVAPCRSGPFFIGLISLLIVV